MLSGFLEDYRSLIEVQLSGAVNLLLWAERGTKARFWTEGQAESRSFAEKVEPLDPSLAFRGFGETDFPSIGELF